MDANAEISIRMTAAEWNQTIAVLGEGPYRIVAPLIAKIHQQGMAQGAPSEGNGAAPPVIDGEARSVPN